MLYKSKYKCENIKKKKPKQNKKKQTYVWCTFLFVLFDCLYILRNLITRALYGVSRDERKACVISRHEASIKTDMYGSNN